MGYCRGYCRDGPLAILRKVGYCTGGDTAEMDPQQYLGRCGKLYGRGYCRDGPAAILRKVWETVREGSGNTAEMDPQQYLVFRKVLDTVWEGILHDECDTIACGRRYCKVYCSGMDNVGENDTVERVGY